VQRVFWNPVTHDENRKIPEIRPSEFLAAATLVVLMVWIGVRPNDFLSRIGPSLEQLRTSVAEKTAANRAPAGGPAAHPALRAAP